MFKEFFLKELIPGLKSPMVWIFFGVFALFAGAAVASDFVQIGGAIGNIHKNAPDIITTFVLVLGIFGLIIATAFFNNAALRDVNYGFNEIMFSLPIQKKGYFFGRFFGALILSTIPFFGIFFGVWVGTLLAPAMDWVDAERFGEFYLSTFTNNYFLFILPNMFIGGSIIFFLAHKFKSTIVSFVGALIIVILYIVSGNLLSDIENETLGAMLDVFGIRTYNIYTKYWTPAEKNTLGPVFEGLILKNRLIWIGFALFLTAISYRLFSFTVKKSLFGKKAEAIAAAEDVEVDVEPIKTWKGTFGSGTGWAQFVSFYKTNTVSVIKNNVFRILFLFSAILLIVAMFQGYEYFGLQSYPLTYKVMEDISNQTSIFLIIIVVFFSGELVWRDRIFNVHEVINATPHNSFTALVAKAFALITAATMLNVFFILVGICAQLLSGYTRIELDVYLLDFVLTNLPNYIVFSALFIFIQTLMSNRYVGYFVSILVLFAWEIMLGVFDISSNMLDLAGGPELMYSDMNGFGPGLTGALWFILYWFLFSAILLFIAGIFWPRSVVSGFRERLKIARGTLDKKTIIPLAGLIGGFVLVAGFVYYNTQILNPYYSSDEREELVVKYEKELKKYEGIPQPKVTDIKINIDIFPEERDVFVLAKVRLENQTDVVIDSIHFNLSDDWETEISIPGASLVMNDEYLGYRIYKLQKPMQPGDILEVTIDNKYITKGFENDEGNTDIIRNGTFLNSGSVLPSIGYNSGIELTDKFDRKKYGLAPKERTPKLEYPCGEKCNINYLSDGASDWVTMETVISTSADQIAIAPGSLIKEWEQEGRRYFNYKVDEPSQLFMMFMSARYEVAREKYNDIDIEIYYDKKHDKNIQKMLDAVRKSLTYYEKNFGKYYHKQARIIEFPRYATFAQAFPGTMPYSEAFGFVVNLEDETGNNVIDAVIAHEMAHQWWAHQEVSANMQGGTMLTESFSEYSSLMVMKNALNDDMRMTDFLKYDYDRYLNGRSGERQNEQPLYKVENQGYIHYGKGSVVLYSLQDYIGEEEVNAALREFLEEFRYKAPPYPTSMDFLKHLDNHVPDSLKYLIDDLFKNITLYDLRLVDATMKEDNGTYEVIMNLDAYKVYADTMGYETPAKLHDWVDIGLFADEDEEELIMYKRVKLDRENMTFVLKCDKKPLKAAIDPRRVLIERVIEDNVKTIN